MIFRLGVNNVCSVIWYVLIFSASVRSETTRFVLVLCLVFCGCKYLVDW